MNLNYSFISIFIFRLTHSIISLIKFYTFSGSKVQSKNNVQVPWNIRVLYNSHVLAGTLTIPSHWSDSETKIREFFQGCDLRQSSDRTIPVSGRIIDCGGREFGQFTAKTKCHGAFGGFSQFLRTKFIFSRNIRSRLRAGQL